MSAISTEAQSDLLNGQAYSNGNGQAYTQINGSDVTLPSFANQHFSHLTLYTGDTMRTGTTGQLNTNLKKSNQELVAAVEDTLLYSLNTAQIKGDSITITDETSLESLQGDRSSYEITGKLAKMFYLSPPSLAEAAGTPLSVEQLNVAISNLEAALGIPGIKLDHFILSLPNQTFDENGQDETEVEAFTNEIQTLVLPVWKKLSELHQQGRIGRLGVAEFSKQQLEVLKKVVEAAAQEDGVAAVVPEVNQVNLQDCCVLPKDLISYTKENGIELLTHGDATNILPKETLTTLLKRHLPVAAESLVPSFVLKYSAFITSRGLIAKKGYIVNASSQKEEKAVEIEMRKPSSSVFSKGRQQTEVSSKSDPSIAGTTLNSKSVVAKPLSKQSPGTADPRPTSGQAGLKPESSSSKTYSAINDAEEARRLTAASTIVATAPQPAKNKASLNYYLESDEEKENNISKTRRSKNSTPIRPCDQPPNWRNSDKLLELISTSTVGPINVITQGDANSGLKPRQNGRIVSGANNGSFTPTTTKKVRSVPIKVGIDAKSPGQICLELSMSSRDTMQKSAIRPKETPKNNATIAVQRNSPENPDDSPMPTTPLSNRKTTISSTAPSPSNSTSEYSNSSRIAGAMPAISLERLQHNSVVATNHPTVILHPEVSTSLAVADESCQRVEVGCLDDSEYQGNPLALGKKMNGSYVDGCRTGTSSEYVRGLLKTSPEKTSVIPSSFHSSSVSSVPRSVPSAVVSRATTVNRENISTTTRTSPEFKCNSHLFISKDSSSHSKPAYASSGKRYNTLQLLYPAAAKAFVPKPDIASASPGVTKYLRTYPIPKSKPTRAYNRIRPQPEHENSINGERQQKGSTSEGSERVTSFNTTLPRDSIGPPETFQATKPEVAIPQAQSMDYTEQPSVTRVNKTYGSCTRSPLTLLDTNQASIPTSPVVNTTGKAPPMTKAAAMSVKNASSPLHTTNKRPMVTPSPTNTKAANMTSAQVLTDYESLDLKRPQKRTVRIPASSIPGPENGTS
ncbi:hypothetical protein BGX21_000962, partial [Mortierella sp. AD011]